MCSRCIALAFVCNICIGMGWEKQWPFLVIENRSLPKETIGSSSDVVCCIIPRLHTVMFG